MYEDVISEKPSLFKQAEDNANYLKSSVLLCSVFKKSQEATVTKKRQLKLYNTCITSTKEGTNPVIKELKLSFDLSFQVIREESEDKKEDKEKLRKPIGLRFRAEGFRTAEYYLENVVEIEKWESELGKKINQRGFHQLFKAMKKLGKGNFASVYLGERIKDKKQYAVKAFAKEATFSQQNGKQSLINEIKINRMFDHPNLMKLQGVFESQNSIYIILELIEGGQLYTKLQVRHKFSQAEIRTIIKGLLQGAAEMARKNIIHRDLKPENIMFRKDGKEVVIVDFGLATVADQKNYIFVRCGTPGYVAPEIINIKDMTTKSHPIADVFSLGAIFYSMLFNKYLFPGKNFNEVLSQNRQCDFVLSGPEFDNIPYATADLLRKMLQKQPQLRISAAQALRHQYFAQAYKKVYIPKISFKQSGSCPTYLIDKKNESNFKFIIKEDKESKIAELDINHMESVRKVDVNKLLLDSQTTTL